MLTSPLHPSAEPPLFHDSTPQAREQLARAVAGVVDAVTRWAPDAQPRHAGDPSVLAESIRSLDPCPPEGVDFDEVLDEVGQVVLANGVRTADPRCAAHLHSPTLLTAAAAELAIGVTNQSMDSFDQAPAATLVEDHLVRWLAAQLGLPSTASGVLTAGGTASNLLGLFLARESSAARGRGSQGRRVVLCSEATHFSVRQAATVLGLGSEAVVSVPTDARDRIDLGELDRAVAALPPGVEVLALVGTAGTTDAGAVDPLGELALRARNLGAWFHVDAAVGGAFCLSDRLVEQLAGIEAADSVVVDLHKLWWQPIGASVLLVGDAARLEEARSPSDYLDRADDELAGGALNLVSRSLDTSRRFDALKILVSLRATGRRRMGAMVEHVVDTAAETGSYVDGHPELELLCPVSTVTVLFRWRPGDVEMDDELLDRVNTTVQQELFARGQAVIGRTRTRQGVVALKLTIVNPLATSEDLAGLVDLVATEAAEVAASLGTAPAVTSTGYEAATAAATETLLNCYLREADGWQLSDDVLTIGLPDGEGSLQVKVRFRSRTHRHRYYLPVELHTGGQSTPLDFVTLVELLLDVLGARDTSVGPADELRERMIDSVHNVAAFLDGRRQEVDRLFAPEPLSFFESEQAQLLGHPLHPTPKSRAPMTPGEIKRYSPETKGRFQLHWLAASPEVVRHASAAGASAPELSASLAGPSSRWGDRRIAIPAHPWELEHLRAEPDVAALFASGSLVDLGTRGDLVRPTTSVRTVYQESWPWQLKFSLHVRVTNSERVTLPKELDRAVEAARLWQTEVGRAARRIAPAFTPVHDPAYLTIAPDGQVIDGFSVLFRENPWRSGTPGWAAQVTSLTSLCQDHPFGGASRLGQIVLRSSQGRPAHEAGREWFARFLDVAVRSIVRLYLELGLCFEAHQQNTLVELDAAGLPVRCYYRDSQGYFHREAAHADLCQVMPNLGEASESIFPESLADERLVYYPFLNLALGVVDALGASGCADEAVLLDDMRRCLEHERARATRYPPTLLDRLLDDERWPCKGNLRTRLHDMDELVGDIAEQSVYVSIPNPLSVGRTRPDGRHVRT